MKILVIAKPNSKSASIKKISEKEFKIAVKESPINGKANKAIGKAIAKYFDVAPSRVELISGGISKRKIFDIQ